MDSRKIFLTTVNAEIIFWKHSGFKPQLMGIQSFSSVGTS